MRTHKLYEYIRVLVPQKGIRGYFGAPFIVYAVLLAVIVWLSRGRADDVYIILGIPSAAVVSDLAFEIINTWGLASGQSKRLTFLRTAPDIKNVVSKMLICDEIRRGVLFIFAYGTALIMMCAICGFLPALWTCLTAFFMTHLFTAVSVFIIRRAPAGVFSLFIVYIIMMICAAAVLTGAGLIIGMPAFMGMIPALLTGAAAALTEVFLLRSTVRCITNSH